MSPPELSSSEAERLRAFERQGHDALATSYHGFFAAVTPWHYPSSRCRAFAPRYTSAGRGSGGDN
jgi:hypothetical protein